MLKLATNIKYYRKQHNWTQQQLANELAISRSVIAKWESGDVLPDLMALIKLSRLFNKPVDHLLGIDSENDQLLNDFQQFYQTNGDNESTIDETLLNTIDYLVKNPLLKEQIERLSHLSIKQQKAVQRILQTTLNEAERL